MVSNTEFLKKLIENLYNQDLLEYIVLELDEKGILRPASQSHEFANLFFPNEVTRKIEEIPIELYNACTEIVHSKLYIKEYHPKNIETQPKNTTQIKLFSNGEGIVTVLFLKDTKTNNLLDANFDRLLRYSGQVYYSINIHTQIIEYISTSVDDLLHFSQDYFIGKPLTDFLVLVHPDDQQMLNQRIVDLAYKNKIDFPSTLFYRIQDREGAYHNITQNHVLTEEGGIPLNLLCSAYDLTELKKTEGELTIQRNRLSEALDATNEGIWEYNPITRESFFSERWYKILGYEKDSLESKLENLINLVHPEDKDKYEQTVKQFIESDEEKFYSVHRMKSHDAGWRWIESRAKKVAFNANREVLKIVGVMADITEKMLSELNTSAKNKELEEAHEELRNKNEELAALNESINKRNEELEEIYSQLVSSEEIFRQFAESTEDIFWLRTEKKMLYINNQFEKVWGRNKEEIMRNPEKLAEWIYPDDLKNTEPWVDMNKLVKGKPLIEQYRIVKPNGEVRWLRSKIYPVSNEMGQAYRIVGIATDITEQKKFEDALQIAKEKAQESDRLKTSFLANISHEIRTPMNGIVGFAELITRDGLEANTRKNYVSIMKKSSEQLVRIIDDIIDFAKIEANQIRITKEKFNINILLDELYVFFENQMKQSNMDALTLLCEKNLSNADSEIVSDDHRIRQVLLNLLDNALKYTEDGYIKFGYSKKEDKIEFYVKDSGLGISREKQEIIFERFRQGDEGHTRKFGGTGLGLPISKGLVNLLGGSIRVESEPDVGTSFFFTIPYVIPERLQPDVTGKQEKEEKYNWQGKLFLVVEDDDLNFEYLKILLESTKATIIRAKDGSQAVKICSSLNFDLVLMDIQLPVMNGIQATQHIRDLGIKTPVIAQTAFAMDDDEQKCLDAGCTAYITKPISQDKLFSLMESVIS